MTTSATTWRHVSFPSGTQIIEYLDGGRPHPWLYVYGPRNDDQAAADRDRAKMCRDLQAFLNGGPRPAWLDDMTRTSATRLDSLDGSSITAVGPMYDAAPPRCDWRERWDAESTEARVRLIDRLCEKEEP